MGGQACVFYGAAQFCKDVDFLLLAEAANFVGLQAALDELPAVRIAADIVAGARVAPAARAGPRRRFAGTCVRHSTPRSASSGTRIADTGNRSSAKWKSSAAPIGSNLKSGL